MKQTLEMLLLVLFDLSSSTLLALRISEMCCPLQKMLHDPVDSMQTTHGPFDVWSGAQSHKLPSSTSSLPSRPAGHLLRGNTDPSPSEGHKGSDSDSTAGIDGHRSTRERWWNDFLIWQILFYYLNGVCFAYHYIFTRTLARHSNSHPLVVYAFTIKELWKNEHVKLTVRPQCHYDYIQKKYSRCFT